MIKVRGWQVPPAELEANLLLHPNISDAAVIGIHPRKNSATELPRAYVVPKSGGSVSEDEVKTFMAERLAKYKNLDGGVCFVEQLPRSSAGKVLKNVLREKAAAEIQTASEQSAKPSSATAALETTKPLNTPSSANFSFSADLSVHSYDAGKGNGSRRSSMSTVATVYSGEIANLIPGNGAPATSADVNASLRHKTSATILQAGGAAVDQDLGPHREQLVATQYDRHLSCQASAPVGKSEDSDAFADADVSPGTAAESSLRAAEVPTGDPQQDQSHKRMADTENLDVKQKRLKSLDIETETDSSSTL